MQLMSRFLVYAAFFILVLSASCKKDDDKILKSEAGGMVSHKHGENCMECHKSGGSAGEIFTVAGSVFSEDLTTPFTGGTVVLKHAQSGTSLVNVIEVDGKGNFYTNVPVDFSGGRYVEITSDTEGREMESSIASGACSACHGVSTGKIWLK